MFNIRSILKEWSNINEEQYEYIATYVYRKFMQKLSLCKFFLQIARFLIRK